MQLLRGVKKIIANQIPQKNLYKISLLIKITKRVSGLCLVILMFYGFYHINDCK